MFRLSRTAIGLILILVVEIAIFGPNARKYYCGDSIYWFSHILLDWDQLTRNFRALDGLFQYRPLTFIFYSYAVHPLAGTDVFRQHLYPFLFHGLNTLLVFAISRRIFSESYQSLCCGFFFGVSTIGAYITYDNTFIPDYLYVFFYLAGLLVLCRSSERKGRLEYGVSFLLFLLALFTKEAGVTFPAAAAILLFLAERSGDGVLARVSRRSSLLRIGKLCVPFVIVALAYVAWHLEMKEGLLYPVDTNQPHRFEFSFANFKAKIPLLVQAMGIIPHGLSSSALRLTTTICMLPLVAWICACAVYGLIRSRVIYVAGLAWFFITLSPALLIVAITWEHNLYLPLVGLSWIFAQSLEDARFLLSCRFSIRWARVLLGGVFLGITGLTGANSNVVRNYSWMAQGSLITESCLTDLKRRYPRLPANTLLYVETKENIAWHFDSGRVVAMTYGDPSIRMRFSDDGLPGPSGEMLESGKVIVFTYYKGHLFDVTARRRLESLDRATYRIRNHWSEGTATAGGKRYSLKQAAASRTDQSMVFPDTLGLTDGARDTLVLVPGVTYEHPLPDIPEGSQLRFGVALASLQGSGLMAELKLLRNGEEKTLYSEHLPSGIAQHKWNDGIIDLSGVRGRGYSLSVAAKPEPTSDMASNWLEWGPLEIVPPESQQLTISGTIIPRQPVGIRLSPRRIKRGESVTVEVLGGEGMELDCQYLLDSPGPPKTVYSWVTTDGKGRQILRVNTPGRYVITAIRNALRSDWVPIHHEWDCDP